MPQYGISVVPSSVPPWAVQERIGTSAARYALNSILMPRTDAGLSYTDYRSGVMASGDGDTTHLAMLVEAAATGMTVTVAQGNAVVNTPNQGAYMCALDSTKTVTIPASSGTTNRYDLVIGRIYDDNNTALAGSPNLRQFAVEVVQGDPSTVEPTVPEPPVGAIPLASVFVGKNAASLTGTNPYKSAPHNGVVEDLRGPGIVARGGMRALYGADTRPDAPGYTQPGAYPGDQRWVHTEGFQHQVWYGQSEGWRGVHNALVHNARPTPGGLVWERGQGRMREMCRVTIPYPGTPFMIYPTARARMFVSTNTAVHLRITLNGVNGPAVSWAGDDNSGGGSDADLVLNVAPIMWGPFTAAQDVVMSGLVYKTDATSRGFGWAGDHGDNLLSVVVYPSTVPPPKW